jgi:hypothetical protein
MYQNVELSKKRRCVSKLGSARICGDRNQSNDVQAKEVSLTADVMQEGNFQDAMRHVKIQCKRRVSQISKQNNDQDNYLNARAMEARSASIQSKGLR